DLDHFMRRSQRRLALAAAAVALVLALGVGYWLLHSPYPATPYGSGRPSGEFPPGPQYLIDVGNDRVDLKRAVPLHSGENLHISCLVPRGFRAALFFVDSA